MIFFHIVDDYYLQGILASIKQKSWWLKSPDYEYKYRNDYLVALFMHSFSWTFMIMLPVMIYLFIFGNVTCTLFYLFVVNLFCHAYTDNEKANKKNNQFGTRPNYSYFSNRNDLCYFGSNWSVICFS